MPDAVLFYLSDAATGLQGCTTLQNSIWLHVVLESAFLCPGVVMLKLLDPKSMLPPNLQSIIEEPEDGLKDVESLRAVNRAVEGLPCSLMPDGRSGLLIY
jgi:hypothetical protein